MYKLDTDADDVFSRLERQTLETHRSLGDELRETAVDALALIQFRIQQKGQNASGVQMRTKALLRSGSYSKAHAKRRSERGRQTDQIDFTLDGDLFNSWNVIYAGDDVVTAGFLDDRQADIASYLEDYFGDAWYLSNDEYDIVMGNFFGRFSNSLRGR